MEERIVQLERQLAELTEWVSQRKTQQIAYPLDEASVNALRSPTYVGSGSTGLTRSINIGSTPTTITVPAAYAGSVIIRINGANYIIPYLAP